MGQLETNYQTTKIYGVKLQPLQIIPTQGGPVLHMLRSDYALMPNFPHGFGELYFSEVTYGAIKAWKLHTIQNQLFAVPFGVMQFVLFDARDNSPSHGEVLTLTLGRPDHYMLLSIPCGIWYGFKALSNPCALLCNCADIAHDPNESQRLDLNSKVIPYSWQ